MTNKTEWAYCPECGCEELHHEQGEHKQCANCHQEWFSSVDYSDVVRKHLSGKYIDKDEQIERLRTDLELTRLARQGDQIEIDGLKALCDGFRAQLADAAQSLETISRLAGRDEFMEDMTDVRGYANSRATVARGALSAIAEPADLESRPEERGCPELEPCSGCGTPGWTAACEKCIPY